MKDYYQILGIRREATLEEIKSSYRRLAKQFHPDRNPNNRQAEERFKDVVEAYGVLSDSGKKATYDFTGNRDNINLEDMLNSAVRDVLNEINRRRQNIDKEGQGKIRKIHEEAMRRNEDRMKESKKNCHLGLADTLIGFGIIGLGYTFDYGFLDEFVKTAGAINAFIGAYLTGFNYVRFRQLKSSYEEFNEMLGNYSKTQAKHL